MKRSVLGTVFCTLFCILLIFSVGASNPIGWYCVRNKEHRQPSLDSNLQFIEKYNAYYVDTIHSDSNTDKVVYLTFDVGYENGNVERILDVMKEENVKGAFFILGNLLEKEPALVQRMISDGHIIGNHTYSHKDMTKCENIESFDSELKKLSDKYKEVIGSDMPKYYRPPEGKFDERTLSYADSLGYKTIFWSFAYADWDNSNQPSAEYAKNKIYENIHNGAVILLHPTSKTNADILRDIIIKLRSDGYRFASLDELTENKR